MYVYILRALHKVAHNFFFGQSEMEVVGKKQEEVDDGPALPASTTPPVEHVGVRASGFSVQYFFFS